MRTGRKTKTQEFPARKALDQSLGGPPKAGRKSIGSSATGEGAVPQATQKARLSGAEGPRYLPQVTCPSADPGIGMHQVPFHSLRAMESEAKARRPGSRGGNMQSTSRTPSSHLRSQSCPADQRGVGHGCGRRANLGEKVRRQGPSPRGSRMPPRGITGTRDSPGRHSRKHRRPSVLPTHHAYLRRIKWFPRRSPSGHHLIKKPEVFGDLFGNKPVAYIDHLLPERLGTSAAIMFYLKSLV
jgi:hypothetical protein